MGLAGVAGVVATGVVVVRAERRRRAYTPDQVREQLHARLAQVTPETVESGAAQPRGAFDIRGLVGRLFRRRAQQRK